MHAFLIIAPTQKEREAEILRRTGILGIHHFDQILPTNETPLVGIADIRTFIKRLALKPHQGTLVAGIIANGETLTPEAQQALLKTLEEPPKHAYLFIGVADTSHVLPTIVSRCTIVPLVHSDTGFSKQETDRIYAYIQDLLSCSKGEQLARIAGIGKTKEDVFRWIDGAIITLRNSLRISISEHTDMRLQHKYTILLQTLLNAKKYEKNNVHPQLFIEHAFLTLP